ncbi:thioredoxin family protein [Fodinibius salsisoli]|uniref:Thioredoxin family protein n=1 Tax=Fodinibius salsisoli TaxID=2820877 RepID=A0ABT3PJ63_9BACT|nr:thioredoxin family protein [Fodinibius salsisoli]MCW9705981.1 thioredoxin family protein [Fodinibius salsisoli]
MSETPSTMMELGTQAPDFKLFDTVNNQLVSLQDFANAKGLLVVFMCNHCPYVLHILDEFVVAARDLQQKGIGVVTISSNDVENYPDDSPVKMAALAREKQFSFPYLYDGSQEVAQAYRAACTPDLFLFDENDKLVYRGQFDDSRPGNDKPVNGNDLREAVELLLDGKVKDEQKPSMGCNIKWKKGKAPQYAG